MPLQTVNKRFVVALFVFREVNEVAIRVNGVNEPVIISNSFMGRKDIIVDAEKIGENNVLEVLYKAYGKHLNYNRNAITFLTDYEKGKQPILNRVKPVRPEINYKITENHASEVVDFYKGYIFGNPIAYTQHSLEEKPTKTVENSTVGISLLSKMFLEECKNAKDQELVKDILTCGVGYRMLLPKTNKSRWEISPFRLVQLDPANTFLIRGKGIDRKPLAGVTYYLDNDTIPHFTLYTDTDVYYIDGEAPFNPKVTKKADNGIGVQPIVEYKLNSDKMGIFEKALPVLDAINLCTSDRLNGLAQYIQSFVWLNNVDIDKADLESLICNMFLLTKSGDGSAPASVQYLASNLNQQSEQVLKDDLYETLLRITGVPNREGNTGGDTGQAVILRNGFAVAESKAKSMEPIFEACERELLTVAFNIIDRDNAQGLEEIKKLNLSDIDIKISRNRTDEILTKLQALNLGLNSGVAPYDMFSTIGLFDDPDKVYTNSLPYLAKWKYDDEVNVNDPEVAV